MFKPTDGRLTLIRPSVYVIVNEKTETLYIGQSDKPFLRWSYHVDDASKKKYPLHIAMDQDGLENFSFHILKVCKNDAEARDQELRTIAACVDLGYSLYNLRDITVEENPYIREFQQKRVQRAS